MHAVTGNEDAVIPLEFVGALEVLEDDFTAATNVVIVVNAGRAFGGSRVSLDLDILTGM